jgi:endonuclease/exonuclease/phosphatase family metal-dependent hydrolase
MELKILDLNLWMLPPPIAADNKKRLALFLELVKKINPDIITLQELWWSRYIVYLRKNLKGYHMYRPSQNRFNKSGLVTFSKKKAIGWHFHRFPKQKEGFFEKIASKGYLIIKLNLGETMYHIVNTHLYCPDMRMKKINLTESQFWTLERISAHGNWIICGDLNIDEPEFKKLNKGRFSHVANQMSTVSRTNKYATMRFNRFNRFNKGEKRLDYTLLRLATEQKPVLKTRVLRKPLLSDHYAMLTTITGLE